MKILVSAALSLLFLVATPAQGGPDFGPYKQAAISYMRALDRLARDIPTVRTAEGAVQIINRFSDANEDMGAAMEDFYKLNGISLKAVSVETSKELEKEVARQYGKPAPTEAEGIALGKAFRELVLRFGSDSEIIKAMNRFQGACEKMAKGANAGKP